MSRDYPVYDDVEGWTKAEFTLSGSKVKNLNARSLAQAGLLVDHVHPNSPAGILGIAADDILFEVQGAAPDENDIWKTFKSRLFRRQHTLDFFRPSTSEVYKIKGQCFPFGCRLIESHYTLAASFRNGNPDPSQISAFLNRGDHEALASLHIPFEMYNIRMRDLGGRPFDGPAPVYILETELLADDDDEYVNGVYTGAYAYLALCAAAAGALNRARYVLDNVYHYFETTNARGMMSSFAAMEYAESLIAEAQSDTQSAIEHIHKAIELSPEIAQLYKRLASLSGSVISPPPSAYIGVKPVYNFRRYDPAEKFSQAEGSINVADRTSNLKPGQFIILCLMSGYRTNTPYQNGFTKALTPLSRLRSRFKEVHIVTSFELKDSLHRKPMEPVLQKYGVDVSVLFDETDALSEQLSIISAPTNLVIDHRGIVVADGWFDADEVLWDALSQL